MFIFALSNPINLITMLIKRFFTSFLLLLGFLQLCANENELKTLDTYVNNRENYVHAKQQRIDKIKRRLQTTRDAQTRLRIYDALFEEYYTFRFDSAMVYVNEGLKLSKATNDAVNTDNFLIHRGLLLATSGYYSQAEKVLMSLQPDKLHPSLLFKYYYSVTWLYNFWSAYCHDKEFAPTFDSLRLSYLDLAIKHSPRGSAMYNYLMGERLFYGDINHAGGMDNYRSVLKQVPVSNRLYASSAYALARGYKKMNNMEAYESYLIKAAISDQVCPLKENLALQELSLYLYEKNADHSSRAVKYIYCSMEDAQFYNNRLRMLEISHILPRIVAAYQSQIDHRTTVIYWALGVLSLLTVVLIVLIVLGLKQNQKLNQRRQKMREQNVLLERLNAQLATTNKHRETYLRLFLDISALYISKLDALRKTVTRNIKAGTTHDLLQKINRVRVDEENARQFYDRFDRAFILLYPDFVSQLNNLLRDDARIAMPTPHSLTAELRIFALMRLGVTASSEIATLLFYSTQTIYNYKSMMKNKAKVRETFEEDVNRLCHILPEE